MLVNVMLVKLYNVWVVQKRLDFKLSGELLYVQQADHRLGNDFEGKD